MSYLNAVRLAFSGRFQADPSTVNNDVRHYDNASFEPQYQDYQQGPVADGWWNPSGSGAFRLVDCTVRAVWYEDGTRTDDAASDPVIGWSVLNSNDRTSGKIVDLDPQWQLASQLWGLKIRLAAVSDTSAVTYLAGSYAVNPFRDLWFTRVSGLGGDAAASAIFQSVLTDLEWSPGLPASRFLNELKGALQDDKLSIRLVTYAYRDDHTQPGFTFGTASGVIGPYLAGEPASIVAGRRFAPQNGGTSWNNINYFTGALIPSADGTTGRLLLDLGNALPIGKDYNPLDLGIMSVGSLLAPTTQEGAPVGIGNFQPVGTVPYRAPDWLLKAGGIADLKLSAALMGNQSQGAFCPLAIATQLPGAATPLIAIRETPGGLFLGAEPFVLRIDSSDDGPVAATSTLYATAFGQPAPFAGLTLAQTGEMDGLGGGYGIDQPTAPIPPAGIPMSALSLPATLSSGADGTAALTILGTPPNNPRGYIDGQLYNVTYQQNGQVRQDFGPFEVIAIHLRDAYPVPETPTWRDDIQPIFEQYGNLYPIMSQRLVRLDDPVSVYRHRQLLKLAFSLDIHDPNYMPVTRDLSEGKRRTILKWLDRIDADGAFQALLQATPAAPAAPAAAPPDGVSEPPAGGKTTFARSLTKSRAQRNAG